MVRVIRPHLGTSINHHYYAQCSYQASILYESLIQKPIYLQKNASSLWFTFKASQHIKPYHYCNYDHHWYSTKLKRTDPRNQEQN